VTPEGRLRQLLDALTASGDLTDQAWRQALEAAPRHLFVPKVAWAVAPEGGYRIDRDENPDAWLAAAYANYPVITQVNDGDADVDAGEGSWTSSLSAPDVVLNFLHLLAPYEGDRVLEIGTGSGWTAGLLSARLGEENVTSIEIDPRVAEEAAANLKTAGFAPSLVVGDGAAGSPDDAPFDRVHVTCGVTDIPYTWLRQTRPGGLVAMPWMPAYEGGHKLTLTVVGDGTAVGRFHGGCGYMMMRAQRGAAPAADGDRRETVTDVDPRRVLWAGWGCDVAVAGMLPDVSSRHEKREDGGFAVTVWTSDSDATVRVQPGRREFLVEAAGPRDVWSEVVEAYRRWLMLGEPGRDRFGLTVTPDGQRVWLDSPERVLTPDGR
jgi:protein-L-isoaspartate O-methyltransferase